MRFVKGHGTENDFVILPDPERIARPHAGARRARSVTAGRASAPTACCGSYGPRRSGATATPSGSWTTATPTAASPRCAATGRGCSPATWSRRAWPPRATWRSAPAAGCAPYAWARAVTSRSTWARRGRWGRAGPSLAGRAYDGLGVAVGNPHLACPITEPVAAARPDPRARGRRGALSRRRQRRAVPRRWVRAGSRCGCTSAVRVRPVRAAPGAVATAVGRGSRARDAPRAPGRSRCPAVT